MTKAMSRHCAMASRVRWNVRPRRGARCIRSVRGGQGRRTDMYIARSGQGPDLVLILGWGMHGGIFAPLTERLQQQFTLHVVDLPGHGCSRNEAIDADVSRVADALVADVPRAVWI